MPIADSDSPSKTTQDTYVICQISSILSELQVVPTDMASPNDSLAFLGSCTVLALSAKLGFLTKKETFHSIGNWF